MDRRKAVSIERVNACAVHEQGSDRVQVAALCSIVQGGGVSTATFHFRCLMNITAAENNMNVTEYGRSPKSIATNTTLQCTAAQCNSVLCGSDAVFVLLYIRVIQVQSSCRI